MIRPFYPKKEARLPFFPFRSSVETAFRRRLKRFDALGLTDGTVFFPADDALRELVATASPVEKAALFFFALYPDLTDGKHAAAIARTIVSAQESAKQDNAFGLPELMRLYCAAAKKRPRLAAKTDEFENLLNEAGDCRLTGAILARIDDAFYADGFVKAVLPDWTRTTKDTLALLPVSGLSSIAASPVPETTAKALVRSVVLMILRDGFAAVPTIEVCRADENGTLWFSAPPFCAVLNHDERRFAAAVAVGALERDDRKIVSAILTSGFAPPLFPAREISNMLDECADFPPADRLIFMTEKLIERGFDVPLSLRVAVFALTAANSLCPREHRPTAWQSAVEDLADFADKGAFPSESDDAERFKQAFGLNEAQAERLEIGNKKAAAFQNDFAAIEPLLKSRTFAARLTTKRGALKKIVPFALIVAAALAARFWIIAGSN